MNLGRSGREGSLKGSHRTAATGILALSLGTVFCHHAWGFALSGTGQNRTEIKPFEWTDTRSRAAFLCAEDLLTDEQIAVEAGIKRSTLSLWKKHPDFQDRVTEHVSEIQERVRAQGLGRLDKRLAAYQDRHRRMTQLIEARGEEMAGEVAGGETGLLVRQIKRVQVDYEPDPNDEDSRAFSTREEIYEYAFDAALMRELRELEKQVAQDTGQWSEKREVSGPDGGALTIVLAERADGPQ